MIDIPQSNRVYNLGLYLNVTSFNNLCETGIFHLCFTKFSYFVHFEKSLCEMTWYNVVVLTTYYGLALNVKACLFVGGSNIF